MALNTILQEKYISILEKINHHNPYATLIAVTKSQPELLILDAIELGINNFAENYMQEALQKIQSIHNKINKQNINWHYIGRIQSNKIKLICESFNWIHTVSQLSHAIAINKQCNKINKIINVCIQVNIDNESSKEGVNVGDLGLLASAVINLPNIKLRGLMIIPKPLSDKDSQLNMFKRVQLLQHELSNKLNYPLDVLSMGMSDDYELALQAGATHIRIGTLLFGKRSIKQ